jgi:glutathione S-transferase
MSKITLFSARACPFAHRTRLVLTEKKVSFELQEIDLQNKPAWFDTSISGYGKVPAIDHDGVRLWESAIVNEYLEEVFPTPRLLPEDPARRGAARIWIDYANTRFVPAFGALLRGDGDSERARTELSDVVAHIAHEGLAKLGDGGPFFLGDAPSLVDFAFYPWLERWGALEHYRGLALPRDLPRVARWHEALQGLESVKAHHNSLGFYVERYARYAAPKAQAVA